MSTPTTLFRKEVITHSRNEGLGSVQLRVPRSAWFFCLFSIAVLLTILIALFGLVYTRHVNAPGVLLNRSGVVQIELSIPSELARSEVANTNSMFEGGVVRFDVMPDKIPLVGKVTSVRVKRLSPDRATRSIQRNRKHDRYATVLVLVDRLTLRSGRKWRHIQPGERIRIIANITAPPHRLVYWMSNPLAGVDHYR